MKIVGRLAAASFLVCLVGCASSGVKIDQDKVASLQRGKTTYTDVLQKFGKPSNSTIMADGSRMVMYNYFSAQARPESFIPVVGVFVGGSDTETTLVTLNFDARGILQNYTASQGGSGVGRNLEGYSQDRKDVRVVE